VKTFERRPTASFHCLTGATIIALVSFLGCLAIAAPASAQRNLPRIPDSLRASPRGGRSIRVIIGLRGAYRPEGHLRFDEARAQREEIRQRVDGVLSVVPAAAHARRFASIPFVAMEISRDALDALASDPDVATIEEDVPMPPTLAESVPLIGAPDAWAEGATGAGWTVAILDTGVDSSHPFLAGKVIEEACFSNAGGDGGQTSLCPGGMPSSTSPGSGVNCTIDGCDHGTHVAGIAAGVGSNFSGVAPDANIIAIQIFTGFRAGDQCGPDPCVLAYASDQIAALEHVYALRDIHHIAAVNLSLGSGRFTDQASCDAANASTKAAIDQLRSVGIATVVAAGNNGFFDALSAPACISSAISVGSTTKSDLISGFSNAASFMSLVAPGDGIRSSVPGGGFVKMSGTSMAAPHVTGAWAIVRSKDATASVSAILAAFRETGVSVMDGLSGLEYPRIRVDRALDRLPRPAMSLDLPAGGVIKHGPFTVSGWALDQAASSGSGIDRVHVYAVPTTGDTPIFLGSATLGQSRPDVSHVYGDEFLESGFTLSAPPLTSGTYTIVAYARSSLSLTFEISRSVVITVAAAQPKQAIDVPADRAVVRSDFVVAGWAIDRTETGGTGVDAVHVYAYPAGSATPIFLGAAQYGQPRPDVGRAFGTQFTNSGYALEAKGLQPGTYTLVVFARSVVSGTFSSIARAIRVRTPGNPSLQIDTPTPRAAVRQPFPVGGWAVDFDAPTGTGIDAIHVWAFPTNGGPGLFAGVATYGLARPDVAAAFGKQFGDAGFNLAVSGLPPGNYRLVVYAHSTVSGTFSTTQTVNLTVF
jgi:subtilisin